MENKKTALMNVIRDQRGAGFTEYLILVGLIAIVCIVAFGAFGESISNKTDEFAGEIDGL